MVEAARTGDTEPEADGGASTFELANGVRLLLRDASPMVVVDLRKQEDANEPQVPTIIREDRGGREEPNENDPAYLLARRKWAMDLGARTLRVLAAACVTVDHIPDGVLAPDSDEWAEQVTVVYGLDLESNQARRKSQWVFYQATQPDLDKLGPLLLARAGAEIAKVQDALDTFLGDAERGADTVSDANGSGGHGDSPEADAGGNRAARRRAARGAS